MNCYQENRRAESNGVVIIDSPLFTKRCDHPRCDEVIYRDTLDKDQGWRLSKVAGVHFCSDEHARQVGANPLYLNMAKKHQHFKTIY